jgi:hypothetical protein
MRQLNGNGKPPRPDLDALPGPNRVVIARALAENPADRFATCLEFVEALEASCQPPGARLSSTQHARVSAGPLESSMLLTELVTDAAGPWQMNQFRCMRYLLNPNEGLVHKCGALLTSGILHCKISGFCEEWNARILCGDQRGYKLLLFLQPSFWQRFLGKQPGLEISVRLDTPKVASTSLSEVTVQIRPVGCSREHGEKLLKEVGPVVLDSLRANLQANPERRIRQRLRYDKPLLVSSTFLNNQQGTPMQAKGKDLSATGMGLYLPAEPQTQEVSLHVSVPGKSDPVVVPAKIVRVQPTKDGWFEVGARFLLDDPLQIGSKYDN